MRAFIHTRVKGDKSYQELNVISVILTTKMQKLQNRQRTEFFFILNIEIFYSYYYFDYY